MDEEMSKIFKKILISVLITIILIIPFILYVYKKYDNGTSDLLAKIQNEDHLLIFITSNNCTKCDSIEKSLENTNYIEINKDKDNSNYKILLNKINLDEKFAPSPSLIYVENGELNTNVYEFDEFNIEDFLTENNLYKE